MEWVFIFIFEYVRLVMAALFDATRLKYAILLFETTWAEDILSYVGIFLRIGSISSSVRSCAFLPSLHSLEDCSTMHESWHANSQVPYVLTNLLLILAERLTTTVDEIEPLICQNC